MFLLRAAGHFAVPCVCDGFAGWWGLLEDGAWAGPLRTASLCRLNKGHAVATGYKQHSSRGLLGASQRV
jgi:hypothetical protein